MRRSRLSHTIAVLSALVLASVAPVLASGVWSLGVGTEAIQDGEYARAATALETAARNLPWRPQLWEMAGLAAYEADDYGAAARNLQKARAQGALSPTGWQVLGSSLWAVGYPAPAIANWLAGTAQFPDEPELWDRLAGAYHAVGDFNAEQAALFRRVSTEDDAAARYRLALLLMTSEPKAAASALDAATALNPSVAPVAEALKVAIAGAAEAQDAATGMVVIGRSLGAVEEWLLAARAFREATALDPSNAEARAWLGEARQHLGEDGRADLDAALALDRNSSVVHTLLGLYWRRQGSLGVALAEYFRAAQLEPQNAGVQALLGEAQVASGNLGAALDAYQNAVELAPGEATYWRLLALFCADNQVQVLDVGVAAGRKAVELAPQDPQARDALGWAYAQAGYLMQAEAELRRALNEDPNFGAAHVHLGTTYMRWGQNELAREHWTEAVRLDSNSAAGRTAADLLHTYFPE